MSARKSSADRRAQILAATLDLAFEVGPDHVTTGGIAARLGLTQPAIYKHFPKKEDIWCGVGETLCARIRGNIGEAEAAGGAALDELRGLVLGHLALVQGAPALPEIIVTRDPDGALDAARRCIQVAMGEYRAALGRCLVRARADGTLGAGVPVEDAVMLIFGIIQGVVLRLIVRRDPVPIVEEGRRLLDLQLKLFKNEGNTP